MQVWLERVVGRGGDRAGKGRCPGCSGPLIRRRRLRVRWARHTVQGRRSLLGAFARPRDGGESLVRDGIARLLVEPVDPGTEPLQRELDLREQQALALGDLELTASFRRALR